MNRCCVCLLTLLFASFASRAAVADDRPNFVVIMVDDMGYAGVSCFGNPYFKTPEIDRLAAEGMRLTDFHSSGTVCSPTRAGLLTGRYQQRAGIEAVIHPRADHPEHRKGLREVENTFAELLKGVDYATGIVGKWHQGYPHNTPEYHPQNHGFDEFVGYHSGNIDFISHVGDHVKHDWWHGQKETHEEGYSTHLINKYAVDFIHRHKTKPFCLYVAHEAIHNPVQVPGDPVRRSEEHGWKRWQAANERERIEKYKGMTLPIDEGVGQIRRALEELELHHKTFVFFFSDNGASRDFPSGSPTLRAGKGSVYEGGHRVPAIAWWPGRINAGAVTDTPAISLDVMPTLLRLAGLDLPTDRPLDGVDLSPVLFQQEPLPDRPLFWASLSNSGARSEAMRNGPWKLVVTHHKADPGTFGNEKVALYHLGRDLAEKNDLAGAHPQRAAAMLNQLKTWYADTQKTATHQTVQENELGVRAAPSDCPACAMGLTAEFVFNRLDVDEDKIVTVKEFSASPGMQDESAAGEAVGRMDKDEDDRLSWQEFEAAYKARHANCKPSKPVKGVRPDGRGNATKFARVFMLRNDRNGDGKVDRSEFVGAEMGFNRLDQNKNGFIEIDELGELHQSRMKDPKSMRERLESGDVRKPPRKESPRKSAGGPDKTEPPRRDPPEQRECRPGVPARL